MSWLGTVRGLPLLFFRGVCDTDTLALSALGVRLGVVYFKVAAGQVPYLSGITACTLSTASVANRRTRRTR